MALERSAKEPLAQLLRAALQRMMSSSSELRSTSSRTSSACCHCPAFSQALIAAL